MLYRPTFDRIQSDLDRLVPDLDATILEKDGSFTHNGETVSDDALDINYAWGSTEIYTGGPVREFMVALLKAQNLTWLHTSSAGIDHQVFQDILNKGTRLTTSHMTAVAIAEFIIASVLDVFQPMEERRASQEEKKWERHFFREIWRTKWAIIGFGHIGQEVAKRIAPFEAEIVGVRRSSDPESPYKIVHPDQLNEILPSTDVIVLSTPLTDDTRHMVNEEFLSHLKPGSIFVNVGRGGLVDEPALLDSLENDRPGTAILDVFATEPLPPESPFWHHPKVRVNPHAAAASWGTVLRNDELFLENIARYKQEEPLLFEIKRRP